MRRAGKIGIGFGLFVLALLLFVVFGLPPLVKSQAVKSIKDSTGRDSRIGSISINPFNLTATVKDFALLEQGHAPLFSVGQIRASLSASSIFRKGLIADELTIDRPAFSFTRYAANRYSFTDIIEHQKKLPKKKKEGKSFFSLNNIVVHGGSIDFDDRAVRGGKKHEIRALELGLPFVGNLPYLTDKYIDPSISAVVNGTPFKFSGKLKPFAKSLETSVQVGFNHLNIPAYLGYAPVPPPVNVPSGNLSLQALVNYRVSEKEGPDLAVSGTLRLDDVAITLKDGRPLLKLPHAEVKAAKLELLARRFDVESVRLDGVEAYASRDRRGSWMFDAIRNATAKKEEPKEKEGEKTGKDATAERPTWLHVGAAQLENGTFHFTDAVPQGGFSTTVSKLNLSLNDFRTDPKSSADYRISLLFDGQSSIESKGKFSIAPVSFNGEVGLKELNLRRAWPYLAPYLASPVEGKLDLASELSYSKDKGMSTGKGKAALRGLALRYGKGEGIKLANLTVNEVAFDQSANRLTIGDVGLSSGSAAVSLEPGGKVSILSLLKPQPSTAKTAPAPTHPKKAAQKPEQRKVPPFSYRVAALHAKALNFSFTDKTKEEHPNFTLNNTSLSLTNIQGPKFAPIGLRFNSTFGRRGPIAASGQLVPKPFSYSGKVSVKRIALRQFEDYLPDNLNVMLVGGDLDADLKGNFAVKDGGLAGSYSGSAGVRAFHLLDSNDEDLLKWESLEVEDFRGTLAPFSLAIREVSLSNAYSKIIVRPDGTLNLQNLTEPPEAPAAPARGASTAKAAGPAPATAAAPPAAGPGKVQAAAAAPAAQPAAAAPKRISVGTVVVQGGTVAFSDLHLKEPFSSTFYNLGGRVSGLSSEATTAADVDLRGNLENRSPLSITGKINPLRGDLFVDMKLSFRDIELPPATPYSGTYLGYEIDQGKLFLELKYHIEKKSLTSENKVFLDQFTFGNKVESKKATSLPVRLAIALLKDRNGEIHLDLPVTGRTDDPQFKVWGVVWQMVKNLFVKAATSPFSLLSSLMGKDQDLKTVSFEPGSSRLASNEAEKLKALGKALAERPGIVLEVAGFVNREKDAEGYRNEQLKKKMKTEKFLQMVKKNKEGAGLSAENVEITQDEYPDLLKAVYLKEKFPKPRTVFGTVKILPVDEMTKLILTNTVVGDAEMRSLAHERCSTVIGYLAREEKVPTERMFEKSSEIYASSKEGGSHGRVEFSIGVK